MKTETEADISAAHEVLAYDPSTGTFTWKVGRGGLAKAGAQAGNQHPKHGYIIIGVCGTKRFAHRLAWAMHFGAWPASMIDHINGHRTDNRIANLRECVRWQNSGNMVKRSGASVYKGVARARSGRWIARIGINYRTEYLGTFETEREAALAYHAAALQHFGEFALTGMDKRGQLNADQSEGWGQ